jgi:1-acyl-sn-glycerol-3-phosphate acyltransferase
MRTIILFILYVIVVLLATPVLLFCFLFRIREPLYWIGKGGVWLAPKLLGIRMEVSGREHVHRKKTYVFMCNHLSFLDGPFLFWLIPQHVRVILKKEILRIPVIGLAMRHVQFVPVDRKGFKAGKKSIERAAQLIKKKKYSFLIFPEGTRSRDGKTLPFRRGGFFLAVNSQVPIVPISIDGSFDLMPKGSFFIRKGTVKVKFHAPISCRRLTIDDMPELMEKTRKVILSGLSQNKQDEDRVTAKPIEKR